VSGNASTTRSRTAKDMRIAWLTPLSRRSAICRYSLAVVRGLSQLACIDVLYPPTGDDVDCPWAKARIPLSGPECAAEMLDSYDAVFYNFGNNCEHHSAIYQHYLRMPGISILHDKVMQGFFTSYNALPGQDRYGYVCLMAYLYGEQGRKLAMSVLTRGWSHSQEMLAASQYPLFEPCLFNAKAAVVHSESAARLVSARYGDLLPVATLELPAPIHDFEYTGQPLLDRRQLSLPDDTLVVMASGTMNPSKRLDVLLRVMGKDHDLRRSTILVLAGGGDREYLEVLRRIAHDLRLSDRVRFVLGPTDLLMHSYIAAADICVNLRNPSTESASASLLEQLHFGKPVLVSRVGMYDELPDDVVAKTDLDDEESSLRRELSRLVLDVGYRESVASAAGAYAEEHHHPQVYAQRMMAFLEDLASQGRRLSLIDEAARLLVNTRESKSQEAAARRMAEHLAPGLGRLGKSS
jgi:glycosyltransferase involved in cell wall biosynthesis